MEARSPIDYSHYIDNENAALPATAIHRHARAGYHTTMPGEKLVPGITMDFDLSDPFFTEYKPGEYRALHDPYLKHFLNKKSVRRCLMKNNLITKDGEVRCTLREFNRFQRNLKHYFKTQRRIASALEKKKFYVDPRKILRNKVKNAMLQKRIQHNVKIAEAKARHTESMMKRRKQILNRIIQKDRGMAELISRVRLEREEVAGQAQMERKRRELLKIRLDSCELIRRCTILQRIRQRERIVAQKQLLKKQRRLKEFSKQNLEWHKERMNAKDEEMIKFLDQNSAKQAKRKQSILARTIHSEQNKNTVNEQRKGVFDNHVRIEDIHLGEARAWEKKVEKNRAKAANNWRAKMHCMQTIAEGRMADIERRKYDRKRNSQARKKAQIEENLNHLEKMDVTVLGTTGCGSHELANIHRDNSKIRFSAYYDPGRDTIDPCRTTQFHAYFKPLHVIHAKYQPGMTPKPPPKRSTGAQQLRIHHVPSVKPCVPPNNNFSLNLLDDLLSQLVSTEIEEVFTECQEEMENELFVTGLIGKILDDVVCRETAKVIVDGVLNSALDHVAAKFDDEYTPSTLIMSTKVQSNFSFLSDSPEQSSARSYFTATSLDCSDLVEDVVKKIMACFEGKDKEVYQGQTSITDCSTRDGEEVITDIITRLIATVQNFTKESERTIDESAESILSSYCTSSRESLKDLHRRAQFLLNHALDVAEVKLKLRGYSYLTWNVLEDCLVKAKDAILENNIDRVADFSDVELVEWVMDDAKKLLQGATTLLYEMLHESGDVTSPENKLIVEECYMDQVQKADQVIQSVPIVDEMLEKCAKEGDVAKFAVVLAKKVLHNASLNIPRRSSVMLSEALRDGNFDLAGSILAAKAVTVAYKELVLDPQTPSQTKLKDALRRGDVEEAGTILANRALQQAMNIHHDEDDPIEDCISSMILEHALEVGDLDQAGEIVIGRALQEALYYVNAPITEIKLEQALRYGDLEVAGILMAEDALEQGMVQLMQGTCQEVRRDSSIVLDKALFEGDLPTAGTVMTSRALRQGMAEIELEEPAVLRRDSSIALEKALETGDLPVAGDIIVSRLLKSGMSEVNEETATEVLNSSSSEILDTSLKVGDLETAAPILVQRAILSALKDMPEKDPGEDNIVEMSSSAILKTALNTGDLEEAGNVVANRALRSGLRELTPSPTKTLSDIDLESFLEQGDLEKAADILTERALKTPVINSCQEVGVLNNDSKVSSVQSYEELKIEKTHSVISLSNRPTYEDGLYFLEALKKTGIDEQLYDRGATFVKTILEKAFCVIERLFEDDAKDDYALLKSLLLRSDFDEAANVLVKILLDIIRLETVETIEEKKQRTKFASLTVMLIFQSCLEMLRGAPGFEMMSISSLLIDHLRNTLSHSSVNGVDAIISIILGRCLNTVSHCNTMKVKRESSIELFEACRTDDKTLAGHILSQKVLKKAETVVNNDVTTYKCAADILSETPEERKASSSVSVKSTKSKKKINTEGLPMPPALSVTNSKSFAKSSNNYEPVRELLMSEEREFMVNKMVSNSERKIKQSQSSKFTPGFISDTDIKRRTSIERLAELCNNKIQSREVGDTFIQRESDVFLPLIGESGSSASYVRKIQSKGHVYYINEDGVIKKRAKSKKKRSSKKRLSQDDLNVLDLEQDSQDKESSEGNPELQTATPETSLFQPTPPTDIPSASSKKSLENRRNSFKKKESSLQMLAVINSSYTNMLGKKSSESVQSKESESEEKHCTTSSPRKLSIDEMLSETDKELIHKLSTESAKEKQTDNV